MKKYRGERYQLLQVLSPAAPHLIDADHLGPPTDWASQLDVIRDITTAVTSATEPAELYRRIHDAIARVIPADALVIGLVPEATNQDALETAIVAYCAEGETIVPCEGTELSPPLQEAMRSHQARIINQIPDKLFRAEDHFGDPDKHVQALLCAPLIVDRRLIGVIAAESYAPNAYDDEQARLLEAIARSVAVAIQRSQLLASLRSRIERESRVREMVGFISGTLNEDEVLDRTAHAIFEFIPNRCTAIAISDGSGMLRSRRRYAYNRNELESGLPPLGEVVHPESLIQQAYDREQLICLPDISAEQSATLRSLHDNGVHSAVAIPIPQADGYRGAVFVARDEVDAFERNDLELLQTITGLLGAWLRNAELYKRTTTYAHDLEDVQRISRIVASDLDVERTLSELIALVPRMLDAEGCSVRLIDGDDFLLAAAAGNTARSFDERIPISFTEARDMPATLEPIFKTDLHSDEATRDNARRKGILARGWAAAPLVDERGKMFGALSVHTDQPREWTERDRTILLALATAASQAYRNARAYQTTRSVLRASIESLAASVDAKDPATLNHSRRVASLTRMLASELDLPTADADQVELAALLHDIGKIGIPDRILQKPGELDDREWEIMRRHPIIGEQILDGNQSLVQILPLVRHHHERWDGAGYPDGLAGDEIPFGAAIVGLAEALETMTGKRSYSQSRTWDDAVGEIRSERCRQFHPEVVDALLAGFAAGRLDPGADLDQLTTPDVPHSAVQRQASDDPRSLIVFHRVAEAIRELTELETFAARITTILNDALDEQSVTVYLRDDDTGILIPYGKVNDDVLPSVSPGVGIVGRVATTGMPSRTSESIPDSSSESDERDRPASEIAVPISIDGDIIGVLYAQSPHAHDFTGRDEHLLGSTAALLARSIQTARLHDELQRLSRTDPLTGLANHRAFYERLEGALEEARVGGTPLSLAIIDLNKLKTINDTYGHVVGDEALRSIAQVLLRGSRPNDIVCRYGGDEFAIILRETEMREAQQVMTRLQRVISSRSIVIDGHQIGLPGGAWGIASFPYDGDRPATLVATADARMYESKP